MNEEKSEKNYEPFSGSIFGKKGTVISFAFLTIIAIIYLVATLLSPEKSEKLQFKSEDKSVNDSVISKSKTPDLL